MSNTDVKIIGLGVNRVDGRAKVTGRANYAADNYAEGLVHAVGVFSPVASARITKLDTEAAEHSPGVIAVLHHGNAPKLYRSPNKMADGNRVGEVRPLFEDDKIYYAGQFVAVVVAGTFEQARTAARLVRVVCAEDPPVLAIADGVKKHDLRVKKDSPDSKRGDPQRAWSEAPVRLEATYVTPVEVHNPMEMHASVAQWKGDRLETHESTQWVVGQHKALAKMLGLAPENVTVYSPYIGGGFGGKLFLWPHTQAAVVAARATGRPVKLILERKSEFTTVGHRPATQQRFRIGATSDGRLLALQHDTLAHTSMVDEFLEDCGETTLSLYHCANVAATHRMVPVNVGTPTAMRAPGAASGTFALESAMDELAATLKMDPIELRLRNFAERDEHENKPWSSNHLRECYQIVSDRFGWKRRNPEPGSMRDGSAVLGWGFAAASWPSARKNAAVRVELRADGTARVSCATQDIGTGTYTVVAQVAAEVTGLPLEKIEVALGNSAFPEGPISGGSMATATVVPAVAEASRNALENLRRAATSAGAPFAGQDEKKLAWRDGALTAGERRATVAEILASQRLASVDGEARAEPDEKSKQYTFQTFGAHAVEVRCDPAIARVHVSRVVSAFDAGRVINRKTATNQIEGSLIMGIGMALMEVSVLDPRNGRVITDNLADYHVPVHADAPEMDVTFIDRPDPEIGEFGMKGVGEIGITGIAAAVANAIYHATGRRVRDLPITPDKLLA
ncbi:MAG TPA: xanthine dehydrogenase family protein molybdopterin-binding subunit [Opitutaceae bacterium]|nr:xanthine dehydrogenase family protein molybdopterin-binding subunit [Opitutaceae bacterium]